MTVFQLHSPRRNFTWLFCLKGKALGIDETRVAAALDSLLNKNPLSDWNLVSATVFVVAEEPGCDNTPYQPHTATPVSGSAVSNWGN